jgi:hypothetical protein
MKNASGLYYNRDHLCIDPVIPGTESRRLEMKRIVYNTEDEE